MTGVRVVIGMLIGVGCVLAVTDAQATIEARCSELGANCVCSEPFNVETYDKRSGSAHYRASDVASTTLPCGIEGVPYSMLLSNGTPVGVNSGTVFTSLPSGHTVSYVLKFPDNHTGLLFYGHDESQTHTPPWKRLAARFYVWHGRLGGEFDWAGENGCTASKLAELGASTLLEHSQGHHVHLRGMNFWNPFIDCCGTGDFTTPGPGPDNLPSNTGAGKEWWEDEWTRVEAVVVNSAGTGSGGEAFDANGSVRIFVYIKQMGESTEYEIVNTVDYNTWSPSESVGWDNTINHKPNTGVDAIQGDHFRDAPTGSCRGFYAASHYMMAGWDTDDGQRIGASTEFEGTGGEEDPPASGTLALFLRQVAGLAHWLGLGLSAVGLLLRQSVRARCWRVVVASMALASTGYITMVTHTQHTVYLGKSVAAKVLLTCLSKKGPE